jgi:hypothetical protein
MAGAAGSGFLHFSHSVVFSFSEVENRIVTHSAIIIIFFQVEFVAEHNRVGVFKLELNVFSLGRIGADD